MSFFPRFVQTAQLVRKKIDGMTFPARLLLKLVIVLTAPLVTVRNLPGDAPLPSCAVYAANHSTEADAFIVPCYLIALRGRKISFFIHWMFRSFPLVGWLLKQIDPIWVENRETRKKWLKKYKHRKHGYPAAEAVRRLKAGKSVGIFPEGGLNRNVHRLVRGRRGVGEIVLDTNIPVVPVGVDFPKRRKQGRLPVLGRMTITVGRPVFFDAELKQWKAQQESAADEKELRMKKNELCQRIAHTVMRAIAPLCGKTYPF